MSHTDHAQSADAHAHCHHHHDNGGATSQTRPQADAQTSQWTCPMHPEIVRDGPGACPICGMALEPVIPTSETGPSPELKDMSRRFWVGAALTLPLFALEMGRHVFGWHWLSPS